MVVVSISVDCRSKTVQNHNYENTEHRCIGWSLTQYASFWGCFNIYIAVDRLLLEILGQPPLLFGCWSTGTTMETTMMLSFPLLNSFNHLLSGLNLLYGP